MLFSNLLSKGLNLTTRRFIRKKPNPKFWPNDWVPFVWNRPVKVPSYFNAGDLVDFGQPEESELQPEANLARELKELEPSDDMRKIFSLDHAKRSHYNKARVHEHVKKLGLIHSLDHPNSLEAKIINLTYTLRHIVARIKETNAKPRGSVYNAHLKKAANDVNGKRFSHLCRLRGLHAERFEHIIKELNIEPKPNPINVPYTHPYRKIQMRLLAIDYARELKEKKVNEFMESLAEEKEKFEKEKEETLKWIKEKEEQLGMTV